MFSRLLNFIICTFVILATPLVARIDPKTESFHRSTRQRDFDAVQRFVNSRRTMPLDEKKGFLKISGDLRAEISERRQNRNTFVTILTPIDGPNPFKVDNGKLIKKSKDFDAEVNLKFAYKCNRTEAFAKLFIDGSFGIDGTPKTIKEDPNGMFGSSDSNDFLALKECWVSHIFCEGEGIKSKAFLGRIGLDKLFKSRLQFNSRFNGIMLNHSRVYKPDWNVYGQAAAFVVDERVNHYAYIGEIGTLDFFESKFDIIYSFIYWRKNGRNRAGKGDPRGTMFCNSQLWLAYNIPTWFPKEAKIYASFIYNHAAKKGIEALVLGQTYIKGASPVTKTLNIRQNIAFDVGFIYGGSVEKQNDWSAEIQYQYVQAQAISDADMAGIGRGNFPKETFTADGRGATNFQGYKIASIYAITDNLTVENSYQESWQLKKALGGVNHFNKVAVEFIQAF